MKTNRIINIIWLLFILSLIITIYRVNFTNFFISLEDCVIVTKKTCSFQ